MKLTKIQNEFCFLDTKNKTSWKVKAESERNLTLISNLLFSLSLIESGWKNGLLVLYYRNRKYVNINLSKKVTITITLCNIEFMKFDRK